MMMKNSARVLLSAMIMMVSGCTTSYVEIKGECVMQTWTLVNQLIRKRTICDLPPPEDDEDAVRDREEMNTNPFPDLLDRKNTADTIDPNLLEKEMGYPQEPEK